MPAPRPKKIIRWAPGKPCSLCGQPMLENHLSNEIYKRDYEMKWAVHYACHLKLIGAADRNSR